jgi:hypothetical protein
MKMKAFLIFLMLICLVMLPAGVLAQDLPDKKEARAIAKEAYIYANPLVDSYRIIYSYFVDSEDSEFKAPFNTLKNFPRVYTHEDRAVQSPNSDTPYSWLIVDLRTEPFGCCCRVGPGLSKTSC